MNESFKKLSNQINFTPSKSFKNVTIKGVQLIKKTNTFFMEFDSIDTIPFDEMIYFLAALNKNFEHKTDFQFKIVDIKFELSEILLYLSWITNDFLKKPQIYRSFRDSKYEMDGTEFIITLDSEAHIQAAKKEIPNIERIMHKLGFKDFSIKCVVIKTKILNEARERANAEARTAPIFSSSSNAGITTHIGKLFSNSSWTSSTKDSTT